MSLDELDEKPALCRIFISASINGIRLIDNMPIDKQIKLVEGNIVY